MNVKPVITLILILTFFGCTATPVKKPEDYLKKYQMADFTRSDFQLCYSHGCHQKAHAFFNEKDWEKIRNIFTPAPKDAESERRFIAKAIQEMEKITGEKTGVNKDIGGTFPGTFKNEQMDCEDEAVNTNIFLILLQRDGLLRFHSFYAVARRGIFLNGWPHVACAILDHSSKDLFVVDSWFTDHGMTVYVLPKPLWKSGWNPPEK